MHTYQFSSVAQSCLTLCHPMDYSKPDFHVHHHSRSSLKLKSIKSVMPAHHLILFPPSPVFNLYQHQSFPMSQFFTSGGQSIETSVSASVLPMNIQDWSPLAWTGWISLQSKGLSRLLQHHSSAASVLQHSAFFMVQLSYPYMTNGKTIALTIWAFVGKVMSLLSNLLSKLDIAFLPKSKHL